MILLRRCLGSRVLMAALCATSLVACGNPPYPRGSVESLFGQARQPVVSTVDAGGRLLNTARVDNPGAAAKPMLLFVHGSPGEWQAWAAFLKAPELAGFSSRIAVDRPGFGGSMAGGVMPNLRQQAAMLTALIPAGQKAIVVGHSLGGPLAAWMAIDAPDKVCAAVSIAGSLSSTYEAPRWYNRVADSGLLNWALPSAMVQSNVEMMPLAAELMQLESSWSKLRVPLVLMQGGKDKLVEPATADEVERQAPAQWLKVQRLPQENHFVLWEKPELVIQTILGVPCAS